MKKVLLVLLGIGFLGSCEKDDSLEEVIPIVSTNFINETLIRNEKVFILPEEFNFGDSFVEGDGQQKFERNVEIYDAIIDREEGCIKRVDTLSTMVSSEIWIDNSLYALGSVFGFPLTERNNGVRYYFQVQRLIEKCEEVN
jgi:hypothetical protein